MGAFDFKADDGIATYYIEFAGDVISVSGDELSGRDLYGHMWTLPVSEGTHY